MERWEHGEVFCSYGGREVIVTWTGPRGVRLESRNPAGPVDLLNSLGAEGWQVAAMAIGGGVRYVLKRKLEG